MAKLILSIVMIFVVSQNCFADEKEPFQYFVILWGYQDSINTVHGSHTFATYVKTKGTEIVDKADISWLPNPAHMRPGQVRRGRLPLLKAVPGVNLTTESTLADAAQRGLMVEHFGPYPSTKEIFERAKYKSQHWNGEKWKMLDANNRPDAENCIHKVSDIAGPLRTFTLRGIPATQAVRDHYLRQGAITDTRTYPWILDALFSAPQSRVHDKKFQLRTH